MNRARRTTVTAVGTIVALAGFEHGLGELLQGPVAPAGVVIESWPGSPFYESLAGEPAMTLIPNLAVSGIVTMALSALLLFWVVRYPDGKRSALVIASLCVALLLTGGGFGPPVLGLMLALAAVKVASPLTGWQRRSSAPAARLLAAAWPWLLTICITAWLVALVGIAALDYFLGIESTALTVAVLLTAFASLPLAFLAGYARDASGMTQASQLASGS